MKLIITNQILDKVEEDEVILSPLTGHNIYDISEYAADGECDEIHVYVIDFIQFAKLGQMISHYAKKLKRGGEIYFYGTDIYLVAKAIVNRHYTIEQINQILYGGPNAHEMYSSCVGINDIISYLETVCELEITSKSLKDISYKIGAKRVV